MKQHIANLMVMSYLISFSVVLAGAASDGPPNHPKLLNPNTDRVFVTGLPPNQTRIWKERVFSNDHGTHTALCLENLTIQRLFPGAAPAVGEGVFCLGDITAVGLNHYSATGFLSGCLRGGKARQLLEFSNCRILVAGENQPIPAITTLTGTPHHHVFTCSANNGPGTAIGSFSTTALIGGATASLNNSGNQWTGFSLQQPDCGCDPIVCDPCCASCPDE